MKAFDMFISRLDMAEERISGLEDMATETCKTEGKENKDWKKNPWISKDNRQIQKV